MLARMTRLMTSQHNSMLYFTKPTPEQQFASVLVERKRQALRDGAALAAPVLASDLVLKIKLGAAQRVRGHRVLH